MRSQDDTMDGLVAENLAMGKLAAANPVAAAAQIRAATAKKKKELQAQPKHPTAPSPAYAVGLI